MTYLDEHDVISRLESRLRQFGYIKSDLEACDLGIENMAKHVRVSERHIRAVLSSQEFAEKPLLDTLRLRQIPQSQRYEEII